MANRIKVFAIEGPDAVGKSTQVDRVYNYVTQHLSTQGIVHRYDLKSYHHEKHAIQDSWVAGADAAQVRSLRWHCDRIGLLARMRHGPDHNLRGVIVADRWDMSTYILGTATEDRTLIGIAETERLSRLGGVDVVYIVLAAPNETLNSRLEKRREHKSSLDDTIRMLYAGTACEWFAGAHNVVRVTCADDPQETTTLIGSAILARMEK